MTLQASGRSGSLPKRNPRLQEVEKTTHARNQSELVEAIMLERTKERTGLKVQELGNNFKKGLEGKIIEDVSPASKIVKMSQPELQTFLTTALKSHRTIKRIELYKDDRLKDDEYFEENTTSESINLSPNIYKSLLHCADKLSIEFGKKDVAGVDVNAQGELWIYYWKSKSPQKLDESLSGGRGKKKKKEDTEEVKEESVIVRPVVRIHYIRN